MCGPAPVCIRAGDLMSACRRRAALALGDHLWEARLPEEVLRGATPGTPSRPAAARWLALFQTNLLDNPCFLLSQQEMENPHVRPPRLASFRLLTQPLWRLIKLPAYRSRCGEHAASLSTYEAAPALRRSSWNNQLLDGPLWLIIHCGCASGQIASTNVTRLHCIAYLATLTSSWAPGLLGLLVSF